MLRAGSGGKTNEQKTNDLPKCTIQESGKDTIAPPVECT